MKNNNAFLCTILLLAVFSSPKAQTLLTYGSTNVTKDEFLQAYLKNNSDQKSSEKVYRDYLELYTRFKLKVKAAYDMRLDTLAGQKAELTDFRSQIVEGYLNDETSFNALVKEAFERSQKDIHLAHIYIPLNAPNSGNAPDTSKAWKLAVNAYDELKRGSDFGNVAGIYSSDPAVRINKGDIGYVTVFTLPYALESLAYTTPTGNVSLPYRSKSGYHIFKNLGERKAVGRLRAAQILFAFPPDADNSAKAAIKGKADSVYNVLMHGASFREMVELYSNDNESYRTSGEMHEFGVGKFEPDFENAVFALNSNGSISKPILTSDGYHIVKRLERIPINTDFNNDSSLTVLKKDIRKDTRMEVSAKAMLQKIYQVTSLKSAMVNEKNVYVYTDSSLRGKKLPKLGITGKTILFSFPLKNIYAQDWIKYLESVQNVSDPGTEKSLPALFNQFKETMAREYYRDHLEVYNSEFASQVKEFKEGNLLFEIMQQNIWNKAAADSAGLRKYYNNHKDKYWWEPGAEAIIFNCTDSASCIELRSKLQNNIKQWRNIMQSFESKVQVDSGRFEQSQLQLDNIGIALPGLMTEPKQTAGQNTSFVYIIKAYKDRAPRDFDDAKGFVLNDYQTFLEEKWIETLKRKYPVKLNEVVFRTLWQ